MTSSFLIVLADQALGTVRGLVVSAVVPIIRTMGGLVIVVALVTSLGLAAKGALTLTFRLMVSPRVPITIYWRPVVFLVSLFWFWYLVPGVAAHIGESRMIAHVMHILEP